MKQENLQMEERLWNYIDGQSSGEERSVISKLVETDAAWKAKYHELLELAQLLKSTELEEPSLRFTKNVMEEISKLHIAPATKTYINKRIIWGLGFFFIAMVVGFLVYGIGQMFAQGGSGEGTVIARNIGKVDFSKFFNNTWMNILMMVNAVLGLFLLDAYLNQKRKKFTKEA